jgi:hypothetical protein
MNRTSILLITVVLLLVAGVALAAGGLTISRRVVGAGGGEITAGDQTLRTTIGQPISGRIAAPSADLCAGFWCGPAGYDVFLPLTMRQ